MKNSTEKARTRRKVVNRFHPRRYANVLIVLGLFLVALGMFNGVMLQNEFYASMGKTWGDMLGVFPYQVSHMVWEYNSTRSLLTIVLLFSGAGLLGTGVLNKR